MTSDFHFKGKLNCQIRLRITLHLENFLHQIGPAILWYIQGLYLLRLQKIVTPITSTFWSWTHTYPLPKKSRMGWYKINVAVRIEMWDYSANAWKKFPLIYKLFLMYEFNFMYGLEPIQQRTKQLRSWMNRQLSCTVLIQLIFKVWMKQDKLSQVSWRWKGCILRKILRVKKCNNNLVLSPFRWYYSGVYHR